MKSTGNQSAGNLIWLAGFIDADGCIGMHRQKTKYSVTYVPSFSVTNICKKTIDYICEILDANDIPYYRTLRKVTKPNWTDRGVVQIRGFKRIMKILPLIRPYLITKAEEADLVMEFIRLRKTKPCNQRYSGYELSLVEKTKQLKRTRHK